MNIETVMYQARDTKAADPSWYKITEGQVEGLRARGHEVRELLDSSAVEAKFSALISVIEKAQAVLAQHLPPEGISEKQAINELLGILDGPEKRAAMA